MIEVAFRDRERRGSFDLEALEFCARDVMHRCGAIVLEHLLEREDGASLGRSCKCGGTFHDRKRQFKVIRTVLKPVRVLRTRQRCDRCGAWRVAEDVVLDVVRTGFSPGLRRMMAKCGSCVCFDRARDLIRELAGIEVTDKDVERIAEAIGEDVAGREQQGVDAAMRGQEPEGDESVSTLYVAADGTGVPVLRKETQGRKGKAQDGIARTREVKLGAVFTQTATDQQGRPVRDPVSTTYVGRIESVETFGPRLYAQALRRGAGKANRVALVGDGAAGIWNLADEHFPDAVQIVDHYHANEHLWDLARGLYPDGEDARTKWLEPLAGMLWEGDVPALLSELRSLRVRGKRKEAARKTIGYFDNNKHRMRYGEFRAQGLFIGSGVVEAGCKTLIAQRLKQSGMHWSIRGANSIIALRCCIESGKFEDYWESRRAA